MLCWFSPLSLLRQLLPGGAVLLFAPFTEGRVEAKWGGEGLSEVTVTQWQSRGLGSDSVIPGPGRPRHGLLGENTPSHPGPGPPPWSQVPEL